MVKVDQHPPSRGPGQGGLCSFLPAVFNHKVSGAWCSWPRRMEGGGGSYSSLQDACRCSGLGTGWFCIAACASMLLLFGRERTLDLLPTTDVGFLVLEEHHRWL